MVTSDLWKLCLFGALLCEGAFCSYLASTGYLTSSRFTGDYCYDDIKCHIHVEASSCVKGKCLCPLGYNFVPDSTPLNSNEFNRPVCVQQCLIGTAVTNDPADFIPYPAKTGILKENAVVQGNVNSAAECIQLCIDTYIDGLPCLTAEYVANAKTCQLAVVRVTDPGIQSVSNINGFYTFDRPCVTLEKAAYIEFLKSLY